MKDMLKLLFALAAYGVLAPVLGAWLAPRRMWQRATFALMLAMTALRPGNFMMMIYSIETYRGHTKGYEVSLIEVLALALILAVRRSPVTLRATSPPGLWLYLLWCTISLISAFGSYEPEYALMAASRFIKGALTFTAAGLYLRDEKDLRWAVGALAALLLHHALLCLKMRFFDGSWQVMGWFEHQNPMAMWAYLGALPILAVILHPKTNGLMLALCLAGYGGAGLCILLSVSRAGLAAYAVGSALIVFFAWLRRPSGRVAAFTIMGAFGAVVVWLFALNSFRARLEEVATSSQVVAEDLRDILNKQSAAMLHDHPLSGVGWNNFGVANSRGRGDEYSALLEAWDAERGFTIYDENYYANPLTESLYWLWLSETGYPGLAVFLLFCAATVWWAARVAWSQRGTLAGSVAAALALALLICYLHGTVERILTQTKNLSHWLMLAGMVSGMEMNRRALRDAT
ncbi:hypothetical protein BH11VER1_BH11VER1_19920 [soil metagenome]